MAEIFPSDPKKAEQVTDFYDKDEALFLPATESVQDPNLGEIIKKMEQDG